jgi:hypothetical protein
MSELLANSLRLIEAVKGAAPADNGKIAVSFEPHDDVSSITLAEAALRCGVDHFNWVNRITSLPTAIEPLVVEGLPPAKSLSIDTQTGEFYVKGTAVNDPLRHDFVLKPASLQIYYPLENVTQNRKLLLRGKGAPLSGGANEWRGSIQALQHAEDDAVTYDTEPVSHPQDTLVFSDRPALPEGLNYQLDDHMEFETSLVGVKQDGTIVYWNGVGTNFRWKSNSVAITGADQSGGVDFDTFFGTGFSGDINSGGIYDVQFDITVPEPSALGLFSATALCFLGVSSRDLCPRVGRVA